MYRNQRGFTLVEMMVVVAIISVLATLAKFGYDGYVENARQSEAKLSLPTLLTAMDLFKTEYGVYAYDLNGIKYIRKGSNFYYSTGFQGVACSSLTNGLYSNVAASYTLNSPTSPNPVIASLSGGGGSATYGCQYVPANKVADLPGAGCSPGSSNPFVGTGIPTDFDSAASGSNLPSQATSANAAVGANFLAASVGSIKGAFRCDVWTIDDSGNLQNIQAGR